MTDIRRFSSAVAELGEAPIWSARDGALYWIDVIGRRLFRQVPGEDSTWSSAFAKIPATLGLRAGGGMIFAFRNGLALADRPDGPLLPVELPGIDFSAERFNDGKVDRRGRFWVGSFHPRIQPGGGSLFRIDPDLAVRRMDSGVTLSNGIGWSPDDRTMYFADSEPGRIWCYDFDSAAGEIGPRRTFVEYPPGRIQPDGLTVDSEGFVWVAELRAGRIARYDPAGKLERSIAVPVSKPTSVIFGGPDFRTLFVTSMRLDLSERELAAEPLAGSVFAVPTEAKGMPEPVFAG